MTTPTFRREVMSAHFTKYHVDGLPFSLVLHHFTAAEPDADPHDHPWGFTSFVLSGGYVEEVFSPLGTSGRISRQVGQSFRIEASHVHRVVRLLSDECWTAILPGPAERVSGFYRWAEDGTRLHRPWDRPDFRPITDSA